jgi:glycosyltransferase involved in cell wall biosynthesis
MRFVYAREAKCLAAFERTIAERAASTLVVNERERDAMRALTSKGTVTVVPCGVDVGYFQPPAAVATDRRVVFCGVMNYEPNERGALWLARAVWPLVLEQVPDARLDLVGSEPSRRLRQVAWREPTITVTGTVPDVRPYLWGAAAAAAPLHIARGIQTKVLEAVAAGLPAVVTPAVAAGLPAAVMAPCRIAEDAPAFARELIDLLRGSDAQRRAMRPADAELHALGWDARLAPLGELLERAAQGQRQVREPGRLAATAAVS